MAPRDRRALWPRRVLAPTSPSRTFFPTPSARRYGDNLSFPPLGCLARPARCDRRLMSEIDLGIDTLAGPALIRHPRKKK